MSPTPHTIRIGFMPLTDCASLVMAAERGFDLKYGIRIVLSRETSWASVRDKLVSGALDAAHALYGLMYGVDLGIGCQRRDMAVLMNLSQNGQAITVSRALAARGALRESIQGRTFAQTFPTGNHAMLLNYWLAANGVDPLRHVRTVTVPPTQMVPSLREGMIDGFCAGEPFGQRAVIDGIGVTVATSQQIWPDHPGKVLGATASFVAANQDACRALVAAVLDAGRWIDASDANKAAAAEVLSGAAFLNTPATTIAPRMLGQYDNWQDPHGLRFYGDGAVNFPWLSDGMWFMTQFRRWGLLGEHPDYAGVAACVNQVALYRQGAELAGTPVPAGLTRSSTLIDGRVWDGADPRAYAESFG
ncbi:MAG: CmpA/NrtA family ABC transporter substrate-binding protein [Pseudomonadota bacterium]